MLLGMIQWSSVMLFMSNTIFWVMHWLK